MFNIQNCKDIQEKLNSYEEKIKVLEELKLEIIKLQEDVQNKCSHDLVLCYAPESYPLDKKSSNVKKAHCLVCDSYLELDGTFEMFSEEEIDEKNIIDITNIVDKDFQRTSRGGISTLVLRAKEQMKKIINDGGSIPKDKVKEMIINDFKCYNLEMAQKKTLKRI